MSLLHVTWLPVNRTSTCPDHPAIMIWADTWRASKPIEIDLEVASHPFTLSYDELSIFLKEKNLIPKQFHEITANLTLPSKTINSNTKSISNKEKSKKSNPNQMVWAGLPLQAGEPFPSNYLWWPWQVQGFAIEICNATEWLSKLPLSRQSKDLGDEILWWSHLQRWSLGLIARGQWLPQVQSSKNKDNNYKARWVPLINRENDRRLLEELSTKLPRVAACTNSWSKNKIESKTKTRQNTLASYRHISSRLEIIYILEELIDAQIRRDFQPGSEKLDYLLASWEEALGTNDGIIKLDNEEAKRLASISKNWRESIAGTVHSARACLVLDIPKQENNLWEVKFYLQSEVDPTVKVPAGIVWSRGKKSLQLGEIKVDKPGEILLEGLGRALTIFNPIERGLESAVPEKMELTAAEAFVLVRTASSQIRDIGIGVELPKSLSGVLASRLGLKIKAELIEESNGFTLGENLNWNWELMIGGVSLTLHDLERLSNKKSPLVCHENIWIELRPNDLKNAEKFCNNQPIISLDDALRITSSKGETLMKLPIHDFEAGPRLQYVLEQYHQKKSPDPLPAPEGFIGQLRPYQERGLGWLAFLRRFDQGACLADDMGLGKTIQILAFLQYLKINKELKGPVLLVAPTSVLTNWMRESNIFTPNINTYEFYGPKRPADLPTLQTAIDSKDLVLTSYGLIQRDIKLINLIHWQGIVIDEAQAIKNPNAKQSEAIRLISNSNEHKFRIALTGTPVENRVSEIWALMNFLNPKVLREQEFFRQRYQLPIERYGDLSSLRDLKSRVSPFILRRLKTDKSIIQDLPEKVELSEWVTLNSEQKLLYQKTIDKTLNDIATSPHGKRQGKILSLLTNLKQICNHPALALKEKNIGQNFINRSGKLERLHEILEEIFEAGDRAILFTQFAEWGHLLQAHFKQEWLIKVPFLHGGSNKTERQRMIDQFQEDPRGPQLFLLSLKAGGVGLNLTRANHVLHLDRWWNPAVENQATDRAYRIGQSQRVMVHKFITSGSVEERINQMIIEKSKLAGEFIGAGEEWLGNLGINELKKLVSLQEN